MSFNILAAKNSINTAIEFSTCGKQKEALETFSNFGLSEEQNEAIRWILIKSSLKVPKECIAERVQILSILSGSPQEAVAKPVIEPVSRNTNGFRYRAAPLTFLGENFKDHSVLGNSEGRDLLVGENVNIRCYHDFDKLKADFNFSRNGFQYCNANSSLLNSLQEFSKNPLIDQGDLAKTSIHFISSWGKENGIDFQLVVPVGFLHRNLDPKSAIAGKAFHLAHADFRQSDISILEKQWKPLIGNELRELSPEELQNAHIVQIVNLWMPLNCAMNTLTLLNKTSVDSSEMRPFKNTSQNGIISQSLQTKRKHEWVACEAMKIGQVIIFDSCLAFHSAVELPEKLGIKYDKYRKSMEGRFAFISCKPRS